ncbi:MAG: hypothetical protein U0Y82_10215 [Thermoleophilia bacterium]
MGIDLQTHADWLHAALPPWPRDVIPVRCLVPAQYGAYARILHPVDRMGDDGEWSPMRWAEHIEAFGPVIVDGHPVDHLGNGGTLSAPSTGWIDRRLLPHLLPLLSRDREESIAVGVWLGFGGFRTPPGTPTVAVPGRRYALATCPLRAVGDLGAHLGWPGMSDLVPQVWWPADRSWYVASDIDLEWTYVGGSEELVAAILAEPALEAARVQPDDSVVDVPGVVSLTRETP